MPILHYQNDRVIALRRLRLRFLMLFPALLLFAETGTGSPTVGAHTLAFYPCNGSGGLPTPAFMTQTSGSTILAWVGRGNKSAFTGGTPLDTKTNTYVLRSSVHD